jgi:vanillate O-demethylase ferredoxin subunit
VIAVQREAVSRGGSASLHDRFAEGSPVTLSRPRNNFRLDESAPRYALFSGGIGLTPILAMASRLHALGRDFIWHVSARSRSRLAWAKDLGRLPFRDRVVIHLSQEKPFASRLDIAAEISRLPDDAHIYACGPARFMDALVAAAQASGIPTGRVHLEHFGAEIDVNGDPFTVVAKRSGKEFRVAAQETILAALRREDIHVETSCQNGVCGSCLTTVLDGTPDHRDMVLTAEEKAENDRMTVCCSRSRSAVLVLDI